MKVLVGTFNKEKAGSVKLREGLLTALLNIAILYQAQTSTPNSKPKLTLAAFEEFGFSNMFQICCLILAQYSPAKGLSCLHNNYLSLDK